MMRNWRGAIVPADTAMQNMYKMPLNKTVFSYQFP